MFDLSSWKQCASPFPIILIPTVSSQVIFSSLFSSLLVVASRLLQTNIVPHKQTKTIDGATNIIKEASKQASKHFNIRMKFRPLDFDYHAEAAQRLLEKNPASSSTLWILPWSAAAGATAADHDDSSMNDSSVSSSRSSIERDSGIVSLPPVAKSPVPGNSRHDDETPVTNRSEASPPVVKPNDVVSPSGSTIGAPQEDRPMDDFAIEEEEEEESPVKSMTMLSATTTPAFVATAIASAVYATPGTAEQKKECIPEEDIRALGLFQQRVSPLLPPKTPAAKLSYRPNGVAVVTEKKVRDSKGDNDDGSASLIQNDARALPTVQNTMELFPTLDGDADEGELEMEPDDGAGLLSEELIHPPTVRIPSGGGVMLSAALELISSLFYPHSQTSKKATQSVALDAEGDLKMLNAARSSHTMESTTEDRSTTTSDVNSNPMDIEILTENMTVVASSPSSPEGATPHASFAEANTINCRPLAKNPGTVTIEHPTGKISKTTICIDFSKCSPWLLRFLGSIRRRRNMRRLANQPCHNRFVVSFLSRASSSTLNPIRPFSMERMILSLQQSEAQCKQRHAKAACLEFQQQHQPRSEDTNMADKLTTVGGFFGNWKVGSPESRHRLLEGEKGTMVVYVGKGPSMDTLSGTNSAEASMESGQEMAALPVKQVLESEHQQSEPQQPTPESTSLYLAEKSPAKINTGDMDALNAENGLLVDRTLPVSEPPNPAKRQKRCASSSYGGPYSEEVDWLRRYPSSDNLQNQNDDNNESSNGSHRGQESRHRQSLEQALPNKTVRSATKKRAEASSHANEQTMQEHQHAHSSHQSVGVHTVMNLPYTNTNTPVHHVAKRLKLQEPPADAIASNPVTTSGQENIDQKQDRPASGFAQDSLDPNKEERYFSGGVGDLAMTVPLRVENDLRGSPPSTIAGASTTPTEIKQTPIPNTSSLTNGPPDNPEQSIAMALDQTEPSYGPIVRGQSAGETGRDSLHYSELQREPGHSSNKKVLSKEAQKAEKRLKKKERKEKKKERKERKREKKKRKRESTTSTAIKNTPVEDDEIVCLGVRKPPPFPPTQMGQDAVVLPKPLVTQHIHSDSDKRPSHSSGKQRQQHQQHQQQQQQLSEVPPSHTKIAPFQIARPPSSAKLVPARNARPMKIVPGSSYGRQHRERSAPQINRTSESQQALTSSVEGALSKANSHHPRMKQSSYVQHENETTCKTKQQPSANLGETKSIFDVGVVAPPVRPRNRFAELPPIHILCAESFIESWGEAVGQLSSGRWTQSLFRNVNTSMEHSVSVSETLGQKITFCDTHLVDNCDVSLELPNRRAVVIVSIASTTVVNELRQCTMKMVSLTACERYQSIDCVLCVESDFNASQATQILQVQTGFTGDLCQVGVHYFLASKTSLSCCLAEIILSSVPLKAKNVSNYQELLANRDITSRAHFLMSLLPTMTAADALSCFPSGKNPREQLHRLLSNAMKRQKIPYPSGMLNSKAMAQLSHVLQAHLGGEEIP